MTTNAKKTNASRYSNEVFDTWTSTGELHFSEAHLINKYLTDTSKNILEAGTGGGRISLNIEKLGFENISAFDIVPRMIESAKQVAIDTSSKVKFNVSDAANLSDYDDSSFDYLVYLQMVLCFIPKRDMFINALKEAYRVAKKDSTLIFSFLDFDSKPYNKPLSLVVNTLRRLRNEEVSKQYLPWMNINDDFNWKLLNKNEPTIYWVKKDEIISELEQIGFTILEAKNGNQLKVDTEKRKGILYVICKK